MTFDNLNSIEMAIHPNYDSKRIYLFMGLKMWYPKFTEVSWAPKMLDFASDVKFSGHWVLEGIMEYGCTGF